MAGTRERGGEGSTCPSVDLHALLLSDLRWKADNRLREAPKRIQKAFQNLAVKSSHQSETTSRGKPWRQIRCGKRNWVVSLAVSMPGRATRWMAFEILSTKVVMVVMPLTSKRRRNPPDVGPWAR